MSWDTSYSNDYATGVEYESEEDIREAIEGFFFDEARDEDGLGIDYRNGEYVITDSAGKQVDAVDLASELRDWKA